MGFVLLRRKLECKMLTALCSALGELWHCEQAITSITCYMHLASENQILQADFVFQHVATLSLYIEESFCVYALSYRVLNTGSCEWHLSNSYEVILLKL